MTIETIRTPSGFKNLVTIRRDQVAVGTGFIIPILTLNGVSGTTAPVTVDLQ